MTKEEEPLNPMLDDIVNMATKEWLLEVANEPAYSKVKPVVCGI